jgi:hypothetical protein
MSFIQSGDILPASCPTCGEPVVAERYLNFWFEVLPLTRPPNFNSMAHSPVAHGEQP